MLVCAAIIYYTYTMIKIRSHFKKALICFSVLTLLTVVGCVPNDGDYDEGSVTGNTLDIRDRDWIKGNESSKVALIEYSDFQCPACAANYNLVKYLEGKYFSDIKFVYRHFPLQQHAQAIPAARAAEAAGAQGKFWEMHDKLFENQDKWADTTTAKDIFKGYAEELGLDMERALKLWVRQLFS